MVDLAVKTKGFNPPGHPLAAARPPTDQQGCYSAQAPLFNVCMFLVSPRMEKLNTALPGIILFYVALLLWSPAEEMDKRSWKRLNPICDFNGCL